MLMETTQAREFCALEDHVLYLTVQNQGVVVAQNLESVPGSF